MWRFARCLGITVSLYNHKTKPYVSYVISFRCKVYQLSNRSRIDLKVVYWSFDDAVYGLKYLVVCVKLSWIYVNKFYIKLFIAAIS